MLHVTRQLLESVGTAGSYRATGSGRFERDRTWQQLPLDRQKYFLQHVAPALLERAETVHATRPASTAKDGVISCGYASSLVSHDQHLALAYAHPLAEAVLIDFLSTLDRVLVVEDTAPVIETGVRAVIGAQQLAVRPLGRLTGHLPRIGPLSQENIATAFERQPSEPDFDVLARPSGAVFQLRCGGFEPLYHALDAQLPSDQWVAGDVGCSSVHGYLPPQVIDTAYALGTSIATASGLSLSGHKGVAVIGDVGFLHSGLSSLLGAVEHGHDLLVIVLCNGIAAMTPGTQNTPGMAKIRRLVEACDPTAIAEIDIDTAGAERIGAVVHDALAAPGVQVILASAEPKTFG
jgi:indolepyruvate ferredoxin oxidoreductase alpha subunit